MKTKVDKKINRIVKGMNKELKEDVFGDRFWLRQVKKQKGEDGMQYYLYELKDRIEPERDTLIRGWLWGHSVFLRAELFDAVNDFIIRSDFWAKYYNDMSRYSISMDYYKKGNK